jgi:glycosyltransferase involved in cell wall biosynthesis
MSEPPARVCVMMPAHDAAPYIEAAIDSVLAQDYPAFSLLVVDDGSTDATAEILARYAARDARVRVLRNERNSGIVATRNRLLDEADRQAKYLAVLDADDVCLPGRLQKQVAFLERHPDHAAVGCHTSIIDEAGRTIGERRYPTSSAELRRVITRFNPFAQSAVMLRRSAVDAVGRYDPRYPRCQDYELWLRLASRYPLANLDEVLIGYRVSQTQGKKTHLKQTLRLTIDIQRRWLLRPGFFHVWNVAYWGLEHGLLLVPDRWVMRLFKRVAYGRAPA